MTRTLMSIMDEPPDDPPDDGHCPRPLFTTATYKMISNKRPITNNHQQSSSIIDLKTNPDNPKNDHRKHRFRLIGKKSKNSFSICKYRPIVLKLSSSILFFSIIFLIIVPSIFSISINAGNSSIELIGKINGDLNYEQQPPVSVTPEEDIEENELMPVRRKFTVSDDNIDDDNDDGGILVNHHHHTSTTTTTTTTTYGQKQPPTTDSGTNIDDDIMENVVINTPTAKSSSTTNFPIFEFTRSIYNVTIPENSLSKIYATSTEMMGIFIDDPSLTVRYKIVAGDPEKIFRADHKHVGNFFFLLIRIRHDKNAVLNREHRSKHFLRIRATITSLDNHSKTGTVRFKSKCNVTVTVIDCNDISPIFFEKSYDIDVKEDVPLESQLIRVTAIDPDIGLNGEIYYGLVDDSKYFSIHPTLGIIYNTRSLWLNELLSTPLGKDQEEFTVNLTVLARDRGFHQTSQTIESSKTKVNIRIVPVNRNAPKISIKQHSSLSMITDHGWWSSIYAVIQITDQDRGVYGQICDVRIVDGNELGLFRISNQSNNDYSLQLTRSITDFFTSSPIMPFEIVIEAKDCGQRSINHTIPISLDDHFHLNIRFTNDKYYRELHENSLIGTMVLQVKMKIEYFDEKSEDYDQDDRQLPIHYSIIDGDDNGTFGISSNGVVYTRARLDREIRSSYRLVIQGQHRMNQVATTMIFIDVLDDNDNAPRFGIDEDNNSFESIVQVEVPENKPNGTVIYQAKAKDRDSDQNNRFVTYEMIYLGAADPFPFAIDTYTGEIRIIKPLDFESTSIKHYLVFVRAADWGEPFRRQSQLAINISITDVNDHRPQFELTNCTVSISGDTPPFTTLATFSAIDLDAGSPITYKLFAQDPGVERCFRFGEQTAKLELICNLRKETRDRWTFSISASDGLYFSDANIVQVMVINRPNDIQRKQQHIPADVQCTETGIRGKLKHQKNRMSNARLLPEEQEALETFRMMNDDIRNEHGPVFDDTVTPAEIRIDENRPAGTKILTVVANDTDHGYEGLLIYSLNHHLVERESNGKIYLDIDQYTGQISLIESLDYETIKRLTLLITVCDQSIHNQKCANRTILVMVVDVNDNRPTFTGTIGSDGYVFDVLESAKPGTIIGMVHGTDRDSGSNAALEYYIDSHTIGDNSPFSMDLINGTLRLEQSLDREITDKYLLYVTVTDGGKPVLSSSAVITINVLDVNDNAPLFYQSSYSLKIREDIPIGTRLMRISAFDRDDGDSGIINYRLLDTENQTFDIDDRTGNIRLKKSLDYETIQLYNLTVIANDQGRPMLYTSTYLLLEIEDVNENHYAPKFSNFYDNVTIKENLPIGTLVTKVVAVDQDNPNLPPIYQLISGNGLGRFTIDPLTGNIFTSTVLDCERNSHFWLTIAAKDRASVPLISHLHLYIEIEDVNDMPPVTRHPFYTATVLENIPIGTVIVQIEAYDQDKKLSSENPTISYRITNDVPFEIDQNGFVRSTSTLDRENTSRYVLDLEVMEPTENNSGIYLKSRTPIIVNVQDVNEFEPRSITSTYRCYTYSNVDKRLPVCHIIAWDQDDDDQCPIRYEIIEGNEQNFFQLDTNNGLIFPREDFIKKGSYDFLVKISDCHQPEPLSSTVHVIIRVLGVNKRKENHSPIIEPFSDPILLINRGAAVGSTVAWIKTSDIDNDRLCFYIISGNIDHTFAFADTGALVLARSLRDKKNFNQFNLTLLASDGIDNSSINLLVNVLNDDISDDSIQQTISFPQDKYVVNVPENITVGTDILHLTGCEQQCSFSIYSTLQPETASLFEVESWSGKIRIKSSLDFERFGQHSMVIEARPGTRRQSNGHRRAFASVVINVLDVNDQPPQFIVPDYQTYVMESSAIGSSILQVQAFDSDYGENSVINYSIDSGNINQTFDIEPELGFLFVAKPLDVRRQPEYYLLIRATDHGEPPLSNVARAHILVTLPDNSPPKFEQSTYRIDVREDEKIGTVLLVMRMINKQTCFFSIENDRQSINEPNFAINGNNGELYLRHPLDFEYRTNYSLSIEAINLAGMKANAMVFVTVLDVNDNEPYWNETRFEGQIHESMPANSFVQQAKNNRQPLVIRAYDRDSNPNLIYSIVDQQEDFFIEPRTGAVSIRRHIDCDFDGKDHYWTFKVSVTDDTWPKLKSKNDALVVIRCIPINDCPPVFILNNFHAQIYLPTYRNVIVTKVTATDCDRNSANHLRYDIVHSSSSNVSSSSSSASKFQINSTTGQITTATEDIHPGRHEFIVIVSDGKFQTEAKVIVMARTLPQSSLKFRQNQFNGSIEENSNKLHTVLLPSINGSHLREHLIFRILTPTDYFKIARTSGAIIYLGIPVDREQIDHFCLVIEVQSIESRHRIAQALINIEVKDVNDNHPIFIGLPYNFVFNSDTIQGSLIGKLQAVDIDSDLNGKVHYSIVSGDRTESNLFSINSITGHLNLARKPDLNQDQEIHRLVVMATDYGQPPLKSTVDVTVRMVSSDVPLFGQPYYNVTVAENHPSMLPFLTIRAESSHGRQIFYNIESGNENDVFVLDFNAGTISVVEKLDRETASQYTLVVSATDAISESSSTVNVFIKVDDVNDNQPMFTRFHYNVSIPENALVGTEVVRLEAYDLDTGPNARLQYQIVGGNRSRHRDQQFFYISPDDGVLYLKKPLDFETSASHHLYVRVNDNGTPQLSSMAQIWIWVEDINDNPPVLPISFTTSIDEDIDQDEFVTKITANDADWNDRDRLRYKIYAGSDMDFVINETSGAIRVRSLKNTRYQRHPRNKRHYALNVSVSDGIFSATETYFLVIKPANQYSPKFTRVWNNVAIEENQSPGTEIFRLNATDRDDNSFGVIEYQILNEYGRKYFHVDPISGQISIKTELDYETGDKFYWLTLGAIDGGRRLGVSTLRIAVIDQNDNPPRFIVNEYECSVCSNIGIDSTIVAVLALDDDTDPDNTAIQYSIYDESNGTNGQDFFQIAPDTGYIYTRKNLSELIGRKIQFFVKASNIGKNSKLSNVVPVTIEIVDSCENQSKRDNAFVYEVFVKENIERGSIVASLNLANDYKNIDLSIVGLDSSTDSNTNKFRVESGQIFVNEPLDRETKSKHVLALKVSDRKKRTTDYFYVIISIMDENDCTPYFDSATYHLSVAENQDLGSTIFKVNALDDDVDFLNKDLKYHLEDEQVFFRIEENSGWIVLNQNLDRETQDSYDVTVKITDGIHWNSTVLHVSVVDVNDNPPRMEQPRSIAAIYENSFLGTVILRVKVHDPDLNPELRYFILNGDPSNQFAISSSGDVYVNRTLDRETIDQYRLTVVATDGKYHSESLVMIDVLDVNDNGPTCQASKYVEMVSEAVPVGTYILTIEATDRDEGENAKLHFELFGDHRDHFQVDPITGRLKTNAVLDREKQPSYEFSVIVFDNQNRDWHCTSNIEILLSDVNDEPPRFLPQPNSVHVPEDSPVGMILGKVQAIDLDLGPNRQIIYELINSSDYSEFLINERTGLIRLARSLDRETKAFFNLTIMAFDPNVPNLNSTTNFLVNVTDINDNAPEFELQNYEISVDENVPIGTEILKIFATSKDTGLNAEIRYRIVNGNLNETFMIDPKTGVITVAKELDYETVNEYFLVIEAKDQGIPPLSTEVNVRILINDINDMRPQFSQRAYEIVIREDAPVGDKIYQVVASDGDSPPNANLTYSFDDQQLMYKEFLIDPKLGILTIGRPLDREMISSYILEVFCSDNGRPVPLSASVLINVEISDYNDNPPMFDQPNQTVYVQENRPIGYKLLEFNVHDADSALNSGPFRLELVEGDEHGRFSISDTELALLSNYQFNRSEQSEYLLKIKVQDSGNPPLHSYGWIRVVVIQESQNPPVVYPLSIAINTLDNFPGGIIGRINATDDDPYDRLSYSLTNLDDRHFFQIDANEGWVRALPGLDAGHYRINVTVTDGKFISYGSVDIEVALINELMVENSMIIRVIDHIPVDDFIHDHLKTFIRSVKTLFKVTMKDVVIISMQQEQHANGRRRRRKTNEISMMFAVSDGSNADRFIDRGTLRGKILENKYFLENQIGFRFEELTHQTKCQEVRCVHGECREELVLSENQITQVVSAKVTFVSPRHEIKSGCACHSGFGGPLCNETVNECYRNPCPAHKECVPVSSSLGYVCQCPFGKTGPNCNQNAETCQENEQDVAVCYQEFNPISFNGNSYVRYSFVKKIEKLSFRFRTQQLRARILTQHHGRMFVILEIMGGYLQYRFDCGEGEGLIRLHNQFVSDGKWHEIIVERKANTASLMLDRKYRSGGFAPGAMASCGRLKEDIYFGGEVKSISDNIGDEEIIHGFNGCLDNILFNGQQIPFHKTSKSPVVVLKTLANVEFSCSFRMDTGPCRTQPCLNGGLCKNHENGTSFSCSCPGQRFSGRLCEIDTQPCSSSPCQNDGVCLPDIESCHKLGQCYRCQCLAGFTGANCQTSKFCSVNYCVNGGVCEETSIGPKCHCHTGWHGLRCEEDIDECHLQTPACHHLASCVNLPGTFRCVCPANSTGTCNGQSLLAASNLVESYFHMTREELIGLFIIFLTLFILAFLIVLSCACCNRSERNKKKKQKKKKSNDRSNGTDSGEDSRLLKNNSQSTNGTIVHDPKNNNNIEMTNLVNNRNGPESLHRRTETTIVSPEEFEQQSQPAPPPVPPHQTVTTVTGDYGYVGGFAKKNAPIASVSPQMIEIKQQTVSINSKRSKKRTKNSFMVGANHETYLKKRTSLNDSSDSNNQTEGYHWDTSDLYLAGNPPETGGNGFHSTVTYDYPPRRSSGSQTSHRDSTSSPLLHSDMSSSSKSKSRTKARSFGEESSPLLSVKIDQEQKSANNHQDYPSPPLEVKLGPEKLDFGKQYIDRYFPKHEQEDLAGYRGVSPRGKSVPKETIISNSINQKPQTLLTTFSQRSSLNEISGGGGGGGGNGNIGGGDNFSLLTPSSSCSTTPIAALVTGNQSVNGSGSTTSETIDQCSSSMSSSSNHETSPVYHHHHPQQPPESIISDRFRSSRTTSGISKNLSNHKPTAPPVLRSFTTTINGDDEQKKAKQQSPADTGNEKKSIHGFDTFV